MRSKFLVEVLTPKQDAEDLDAELAKFADRYTAVRDLGYVISIPDNPMGTLHFQAVEVIAELGLPVDPEQLLIHINTCHTREHLDEIMGKLTVMGVRSILTVTGDGSERLPKLAPQDLGSKGNSVTSVDLLDFIRREHAGRFTCGVAFNPYEPQEHELEKMRRKIGAGASFIITQPILGRHDALEALGQFNVPVALDAWMSRKLHLLSKCVGYEIPEDAAYDPMANLKTLRRNYPGFGIYLALLGFKTQIQEVRKALETAG